MKKLFSFIIVFLLTSSLFADDVSVEQALQIASNFAASPSIRNLSKRKAPIQKATPTLAYAQRSRVATTKDNVYVINLGSNQGFVLVSGETGTEDEVLGYCDHGSFDCNNCPVQLQDLLAYYSSAIDSLRQNPALAAPQKAVKQWPDYIGSVIVGPLLPTTWNQSGPYNNYCPEGCPTGCVPTAVAQIMRYWKWPKVSQGKLRNSMTLEFDGEDFSGHVYDWDNMLGSYDNGYNATQAAAVANLMADVGKALGTMYSPTGSGTATDFLPLSRNFGYDEELEVYADNLPEMMKAELNQNRPMLYSAMPSGGGGAGHELVVDGYSSNNYFHFNYGWGGYYDGFYKDGVARTYSSGPSIVTNIRPSNSRYETIGDMDYYLREDGNAEILSYNKGGMNVENGDLDIPSTVRGSDGKDYNVTRIRQQAFYNKGNFNKVTLGDNIEAIDRFAFFYSSINELVLSDKIEVVPDEAFQVANIKRLTIGANVKRVGKKAFYLCPLNQVTCKSPAFEADDNAFTTPNHIDSGDWLGCITKLGNEALAMASFDKTPNFAKLEEVGSEAFSGCSFAKEEFVVPPTLKSISPDAFKGCRISFFKVENNPNFLCSPYYQEFLCNSNGTSLIMTVTFRRFQMSLPETVVKLEPRSIRCNIEIPNTIIEMEGAFEDCPKPGSISCYSVVPPIANDTTFNESFFPENPNYQTKLYVPEGTEELYRNAPGWRRFINIYSSLEYDPAPAQARQYYMVVNRSSDDGRVNIPLSEVSSMEISDDGQQVIIKRNGKDDVIAPVSAVDSITWMSGFVFENAEVFDLNDSTLTVNAQKCTVKFDATAIDDDVQLCIRNSVLTPKVLENTVRGYAVDLSLSNDEHELSGTAQLTLPANLSAGEKVHAAYFNVETGKWEPVYFKYDEVQRAVIINTDHLSTFGIFVTNDELDHTMQAVYELAYESFPELREFSEGVDYLLELVSSDDPKIVERREFWGEVSNMQTLGLDIVYNAIGGVGNPLGFSPEKINSAVEAMGYLGTAVSILNVVGADIKGDDIGVASGTLSTILGFASGQMANAIGTPIMSASMACVAFIGVALNKFGTMVQQRKHDLYNEAYHYFYSKQYKPTCYRSAKDWYNYFYPAFAEGKMTKNRLDAYIEQSVRVYCDHFWSYAYKSDFDYCCAIKDVKGLSTYIYPEESLQKQISDEYFAELMNGELVSVFTAIKTNIAAQANKRAVSAANAVAAELNTKVGIRIIDSEWKEGEKSKYAGWKIGFSEVPDVMKDKEKWTKTLSDKGHAGIGFFTEFSLMQNKMKPQLTLYNEYDVEQKTYSFSIPDGVGTVYVNIDLATDGVEIEAPKLKNLELTYAPDYIDTPWSMSGTFNHEDSQGNLISEPYSVEDAVGVSISFKDNFYKNVRFQQEIEKFFKRHDFITVDKSGNINIGGDIVGKMNGNEGTGKFTLKTNYSFVEKTVEESAMRFSNGDKYNMVERAMSLLNGTMQHKISGTFTVTRNYDYTYSVSYTGEGTYTLNAEVFDNIDGWKWYNDPQINVFDNAKISPEEITTKVITADGDVTLKYKTIIKE